MKFPAVLVVSLAAYHFQNVQRAEDIYAAKLKFSLG
jgi:hypothetical protein